VSRIGAVRGRVFGETGAGTAAAVEKAGRSLLLFNPSGKLNGAGPTDNNESARATNIAIEILYLRAGRNNNYIISNRCAADILLNCT